MNRLALAIGLCIAIAGCASGITPSQRVAPPAGPVLPTHVRSPLDETPVPSRTPTASARPIGLVAYGSGDGIWVVNADGTNAHELISGLIHSQGPLGWSRDGSRLLYGTEHGVALTDAAGAEPVEFELPCPVGADSDAVLSSCQVDLAGLALSPDGKRLGYPIWEGSYDQRTDESTSLLVVLDLETELVTRLESTAAPLPSDACETAESRGNHSPSWSSDGRNIIFARATGAAASDDCQEAILTVNLDDSTVREVVAPGELEGPLQPIWSPDGSSILVGTSVPDAKGIKSLIGGDIYTVRSDGTGLHPVTGGGVFYGPSWTRDGRIIFIRWSTATEGVYHGDQWVMDADGRNARRVESTIPALTAAGCMICAYDGMFGSGGSPIDPLEIHRSPPIHMWETSTVLWQPDPVDQP